MSLPLQRMLDREKVAGRPHHWVRVGTACPNHCLFCLDGDTPRNLLFAREDVEADIERGYRIRKAEKLILSGGEPTIHPDFITLVGHAKALGYSWVQTVTNGCRMARRDFFEASLTAGLDEVTFSLHGHTAELHDQLTDTPGSFKRLMKALLRALRSGRLVVSVDVVMCRLNIEHLADIVELALAAGVREFDLLHIIPQGWAHQNRDELLYDPEEHLPMLRRVLRLNRHPGVVLWTNRLPAPFLEGMEDLIQDPHKILDEIHGRREAFRRYLDHGVPLDCRDPARCRHCFLEPLCTAIDDVIANLREQHWVEWWMECANDGALVVPAPLPFGCSRVGLEIDSFEQLADIQLPKGVSLTLAVHKATDLHNLHNLGRPTTLISSSPDHLQAWLTGDALPTNIEIEVIVCRQSAAWLLSHRDLVAAVGDHIRLHFPTWPTLAEAVLHDVAEPQELIEALGLPLKVSGLPRCLAPGVEVINEQRRLPSSLFAPNTGRLDLVALGSLHIRQSYRVKSLRCRDCVHDAQCPGIHINRARSRGFETLTPILNGHSIDSGESQSTASTLAGGRPPEGPALALPEAPPPPPLQPHRLEPLKKKP